MFEYNLNHNNPVFMLFPTFSVIAIQSWQKWCSHFWQLFWVLDRILTFLSSRIFPKCSCSVILKILHFYHKLCWEALDPPSLVCAHMRTWMYKQVVLTLGTDVRQQLGQRCVRLGHVVADEDGNDAVELLSVFLSQHRDGLQDQLHLLQLVGSWNTGQRNVRCFLGRVIKHSTSAWLSFYLAGLSAGDHENRNYICLVLSSGQFQQIRTVSLSQLQLVFKKEGNEDSKSRLFLSILYTNMLTNRMNISDLGPIFTLPSPLTCFKDYLLVYLHMNG